MTEAQIAEAVRAARQNGRSIDVAGTGSLLDGLSTTFAGERLALRECRGIVAYDPADLTITVRAGTTLEEMNDALAAAGQECPIEGPGRSVGGRIASGLSGARRLSAGAIREWLLGGRMVTSGGDVVAFGARTVKNVTGYDLPRVLCGSWGTLGVLTEIRLRTRPKAGFAEWFIAPEGTASLAQLRRPAAVIRTRKGVSVLLEGHPDDCRAEARRAGLQPGAAPTLPTAARAAVPAGDIDRLLSELDGDYAAELGVGIVHFDAPPDDIVRLRELSESLGGRVLALRASPGVPAFGNGSVLDVRVKQAFDPAGIFAPWRFAS